MKIGRYKLADDGKTPILCETAGDWISALKLQLGHVGDTTIDDVSVSTIFLPVSLEDPPRLWETMIFGGKFDQYQERYTTHDEAVLGHEKAVKMVRGV